MSVAASPGRALAGRLGLGGKPVLLAPLCVGVTALGAGREALWVALPEELLFRGLLQGELRARGASPALAIAVGAAVFALAHLPRAGPAGLATFFPGLLFGWLRERSASIWPAVAAHAVANALAAAHL